MTTQGKTVTSSSWVNLVSDLSLVVGTLYTIQNVGSGTIKLIEAASEPDSDEDIAHTIFPNLFRSVTPSTGLGLWVRTLNDKNAQLVITEG